MSSQILFKKLSLFSPPIITNDFLSPEDKCAFNNGGCQHNCDWSQGNCSCYEGFRLEQDGQGCIGRY